MLLGDCVLDCSAFNDPTDHRHNVYFGVILLATLLLVEVIYPDVRCWFDPPHHPVCRYVRVKARC